MQKHNIFIGYDPRESLTYRVAEYSILSRTNPGLVDIIPLRLETTPMLTRPIEWRTNENGVDQMWCPISNAPMSTEFAVSRFAVPFLEQSRGGFKMDWAKQEMTKHNGFALFMDCDMVVLCDIRELFELADPKYAVQVVKHNHFPTEQYHDAGQLQTFYQRKNWSSIILWNLDHVGNKRLTLEALNTWPGRDLHAFKWLKDEEIGELPQEWNYLVGVNEPADLRKQKILHYTNGQPGWRDWVPQETDYIFNEEVAKYKADLCAQE